jgi:pSer/pThr/pTyr-binding forkhead associated (FHA) protein
MTSNPPDDHISRLESRLEQWIEATFAAAFGSRVDIFDIALHIARAMDAGVRHDPDQSRPIAPDQYRVVLHNTTYDRLHARQPDLIEKLTGYIVTLAAQNEYRLTQKPSLTLTANPDSEPHHPQVSTEHTDEPGSSTVGLDSITLDAPKQTNFSAHLLINGSTHYSLSADLTSVGRMIDNDVVVDDPFASRYHAQIRRRGHETLLFDAGSSRGTQVNGVQIREHRLRNGDVIEIGKTRLIYLEERDDHHPLGPATETIDLV